MRKNVSSPDLFSIWQMNMLLLSMHNDARAANKLPPLAVQWNLAAAACAWSLTMANGLGLTHFGPDGSTPWSRIPAAGYPLADDSCASENIAEGSAGITLDEIMNLWLASPGHRANILGNWTDVGFGFAVADDGSTYYTADFGRQVTTPKPTA